MTTFLACRWHWEVCFTQVLDGDEPRLRAGGREASRDIVQFVALRDVAKMPPQAIAKELLEDFHGAVDDDLELCRAEGKTPETAYKGSFNVRISPELHKQLAVYAMEHDVSLNHCVEQALEKALAQK